MNSDDDDVSAPPTNKRGRVEVSGDDLRARIAGLGAGPAAKRPRVMTLDPLGVEAGQSNVWLENHDRLNGNDAEGIPRADGLLRDPQTNAIIGEDVNTGEIQPLYGEFQEAYEGEIRRRRMLAEEDPFYRALMHFAGAVEQPLENLFTPESAHNQRLYEEQLRSALAREQQIIKVTSEQKSTQIKETRSLLRNASLEHDVAQAFIDQTKFLTNLCGDLPSMTGTTTEAPRGLGLIIYMRFQYDLVDYLANVSEQPANMDGSLMKANVKKYFNIDQEKAIFSNEPCGNFLMRVHAEMDMDRAVDLEWVRALAADLSFYLILRNEIASAYTSFSSINVQAPPKRVETKAEVRDTSARSIPLFLLGTLKDAFRVATSLRVQHTDIWKEIQTAQQKGKPSGNAALLDDQYAIQSVFTTKQPQVASVVPGRFLTASELQALYAWPSEVLFGEKPGFISENSRRAANFVGLGSKLQNIAIVNTFDPVLKSDNAWKKHEANEASESHKINDKGNIMDHIDVLNKFATDKNLARYESEVPANTPNMAALRLWFESACVSYRILMENRTPGMDTRKQFPDMHTAIDSFFNNLIATHPQGIFADINDLYNILVAKMREFSTDAKRTDTQETQAIISTYNDWNYLPDWFENLPNYGAIIDQLVLPGNTPAAQLNKVRLFPDIAYIPRVSARVLRSVQYVVETLLGEPWAYVRAFLDVNKLIGSDESLLKRLLANVTSSTFYYDAKQQTTLFNTLMSNETLSPTALPRGSLPPPLGITRAIATYITEWKVASSLPEYVLDAAPVMRLFLFTYAYQYSSVGQDAQRNAIKNIAILEATLSKAETEFYRIVAGTRTRIDEHKALARQMYMTPPGWNQQVLISGMLSLNPPVMQVLEETVAAVHEFVPGLARCSLDDIVHAPSECGLVGKFMRLAAALYAQRRATLYQDRYYTEMQHLTIPMVRQNAMKALQPYRYDVSTRTFYYLGQRYARVGTPALPVPRLGGISVMYNI